MERDEEDSSSSAVKPRAGCCGGCMTLRNGVMLCSVIILIAGILGVIGAAVYIARNVDTLPWDEISISSTTLSLFSCVVLLTLLGLYAAWKEKSGLIELYLWGFLVHWLLDLASTVVLLVIIHQKWEDIARSSCVTITPLRGCMAPFKMRVILATVILCIYKIFGAYTTYLIFRYRKYLIAQEKQNTPILRWLRRASTSSLSSIFEKKWWSPSQVPVIKIDFASDQSSASSYSNESAGYRTVSFGQLYPSLAVGAPPQVPPQAIFASHIGDGTTASYELPALPSYSVVGSERGALT